MTYAQVYNLVNSIGLPSAYYQFQAGTVEAPPFICYLFTDSADFNADNTNYSKIRPLRIELYTDYKDFDLEATVERVLDAAGLTYTREEGALDSERMYMVAYSTAVVITED